MSISWVVRTMPWRVLATDPPMKYGTPIFSNTEVTLAATRIGLNSIISSRSVTISDSDGDCFVSLRLSSQLRKAKPSLFPHTPWSQAPPPAAARPANGAGGWGNGGGAWAWFDFLVVAGVYNNTPWSTRTDLRPRRTGRMAGAPGAGLTRGARVRRRRLPRPSWPAPPAGPGGPALRRTRTAPARSCRCTGTSRAARRGCRGPGCRSGA